MRLFNTYLHVDSGSWGTAEEPAKSTGLCPAPKPMGHAAKHRDVGQPRDHWWVTLRASTAVTPHGARASALGSCGGGDMRQRQDRAALLCNTQCEALGRLSLLRCQSGWKGCWRKRERSKVPLEMGRKNGGVAAVPGLKAQLPSVFHGFQEQNGLESPPWGEQPPSFLLQDERLEPSPPWSGWGHQLRASAISHLWHSPSHASGLRSQDISHAQWNFPAVN